MNRALQSNIRPWCARQVLSFTALSARCLCYVCVPTAWGLVAAQLLSGLTETLFWRAAHVFVDKTAHDGNLGGGADRGGTKKMAEAGETEKAGIRYFFGTQSLNITAFQYLWMHR